jgi:hypothetical protein
MEKMNGGTLQDVIDRAKELSLTPKSNSSNGDDNFTNKYSKSQQA